MNLLLLSSGGGGGNILRSLKELFRRDLMVTQKTDARYAERLRRSVTTRFLDTNEFSLSDVPKEERLVIGTVTTRRLGSRHSPEVARQALEESKNEVEAVLSRYSVVIIVGTGGKGTGAGTIFPLVQMARQQKKLVIPIFVRPSFERHEVEKRRYDHALRVAELFDSAKIRLIEILNDRGYADTDPQPQSQVWERMNLPIARGLRGLLYVLWDLSQVDPSDLSALFAGHSRLRLGFSEIDPPAGQEPTDAQIQEAVRSCWENLYSVFDEPVGTSLVCIQGNWSNVVDGKIKGRLAALASGGSVDNPYNPLYARALYTPKPWGVTTFFAEHTGHHQPLEVDWPFERAVSLRSNVQPVAVRHVAVNSTHMDVPPSKGRVEPLAEPRPQQTIEERGDAREGRSFASLWELAQALSRSDPVAIRLAGNTNECEIRIDEADVRRLLKTFWFRSVFPRFSGVWRDRIFEVLAESVAIPNHGLRVGRQQAHLRDLSYDQLKDIFSRTFVPDVVRADLQLLMTVGNLWGKEALSRLKFTEPPETNEPSKLATLLQGLRSG